MAVPRAALGPEGGGQARGVRGRGLEVPRGRARAALCREGRGRAGGRGDAGGGAAGRALGALGGGPRREVGQGVPRGRGPPGGRRGRELAEGAARGCGGGGDAGQGRCAGRRVGRTEGGRGGRGGAGQREGLGQRLRRGVDAEAEVSQAL